MTHKDKVVELELIFKFLVVYNSKSKKRVNSHVNSLFDKFLQLQVNFRKFCKLSILHVVYEFSILQWFDFNIDGIG